MRTARKHQHGFAAVAAIFLIVVLAALGGFMVVFSNAQQLTSAQDLLGSRAYWAARAGLEYGVASAFGTSPPTCASPPANIDGFTLTVACPRQDFTEAGQTVTIVRVNSTAKLGTPGSIGYIERSITATLEK